MFDYAKKVDAAVKDTWLVNHHTLGMVLKMHRQHGIFLGGQHRTITLEQIKRI